MGVVSHLQKRVSVRKEADYGQQLTRPEAQAGVATGLLHLFNQMNTEVSDLIAGQKIASLHRIDSAYDWLAKQDLETIQRFHISVHDDFKGKAKITIHLSFDSMEKARYWAAKHLRDIQMPSEHYSSIQSYYSQEFPDFICFAHYQIEHKPSPIV